MRYQRTPLRLHRLLLVLLLVLFTLAPVSTSMAQRLRLVELSTEEFLDKDSGLIWQFQRSKKISNFMTMKSYVSLSESHGWRLPTKQELHDLIEIFDLHENGSIKIDLEGAYWLTDDIGSEEIGAWEIGDQCGPSRTYYTHKRGYIRLVRMQ